MKYLYRLYQLCIAAPILAVATVLTALMLHTAFSWADWAGLVLMVATIVLVALQAREQA